MCVTCGCGQGDTRIEGEHEHVLPDGTRVRHSHVPHALSPPDPTASLQGQALLHAQLHAPSHGHGTLDLRAPDLRASGPPAELVALETSLLAKNQDAADQNRRWLRDHGILALNLMSSPGAGKTSLLVRTLTDLAGELSLSVVEGDQETAFDAERIRATGAAAVQINTGAGCHLEADMLQRALTTLAPAEGGIVFIENVGNLVCPALFDLGEQARIVVLSVTEGEDKPLKYPHMFRSAQLMVLTKTDLLPHVRFDAGRAEANARQVNPAIQCLRLSVESGEGLTQWYDALRALQHGLRAA